MLNYIKMLMWTVAYLLVGAALISIFTVPADPKDPNLLGQILSIIWCGVVYFTYTFPMTEEFRKTLTDKKMEDKENDQN